MVGHSAFDSGVLNLHQPGKLPDSRKWAWQIIARLPMACVISLVSGRVPPVCFAEFIKWAWREHYYLFENHKVPKSQS